MRSVVVGSVCGGVGGDALSVGGPVQFDGAAFDLAVVVERFDAFFSPVAAVLPAAEGGLDGVGGPGVDEDLPGLDAFADGDGSADVGRPNSGDEAVFGVVGDVHRFVVGVERDDDEDRPEDLFSGDAHGVVHPGVDGGGDVEAVGQGRVGGDGAAGSGDHAFLGGDVQVGLHFLEL